VIVISLLSFLLSANAAGCHSNTPSYGNPNLIPILEGEAALNYQIRRRMERVI